MNIPVERGCRPRATSRPACCLLVLAFLSWCPSLGAVEVHEALAPGDLGIKKFVWDFPQPPDTVLETVYLVVRDGAVVPGESKWTRDYVGRPEAGIRRPPLTVLRLASNSLLNPAPEERWLVQSLGLAVTGSGMLDGRLADSVADGHFTGEWAPCLQSVTWRPGPGPGSVPGDIRFAFAVFVRQRVIDPNLPEDARVLVDHLRPGSSQFHGEIHDLPGPVRDAALMAFRP